MGKMTPKEIVERLFEYDDFRIFLAEFFAAKKKERSSFSQRSFTKKAGFSAHNFCTLVVAGKRNLSATSIQKIIKGIGLKGKAASFFENLVFLNQAKTISEKEHYFKKIKKIGRKTDFYQLNKDQFFFYEKWYYPVIRELMVHSRWEESYSTLAKMVRPSITPLQAKEAVELLLNSGMVKREDNGAYTQSHAFVTSENVPIYIKKKSRRDVLLKGIEAIENVEPSGKYAAYSTVTMSKKLYAEVRDILDEARQKILSRVADDGSPDEVYEVVFQMFPVSKMDKKKKPASSKGGE